MKARTYIMPRDLSTQKMPSGNVETSMSMTARPSVAHRAECKQCGWAYVSHVESRSVDHAEEHATQESFSERIEHAVEVTTLHWGGGLIR